MATEKRLIDANVVMEQRTYLWDEALGTCECVLVEDIADAPTVDAVEVVHGRWIEDTATDMIACTECGHAWNIIDNCTETFNYCPNCGAKMDGDGNA